MGRGFSWVGVAVVLGLATMASACTTSSPVESSSATAVSSSSTPTTSTASTSSGFATTATGVPEPAKANTSAGAVAYVQYFMAEANQAYKTLDANRIQSLVSADCVACKNMADSISSWNAKHYRYMGEYVSPTLVTVSAFPNDGSSKVLVSSRTPEAKLVDSSGSVVQTFPADSSNVSVFLKYSNSAWTVFEIKVAA